MPYQAVFLIADAVVLAGAVIVGVAAISGR
jgi:hypothetical protein